MRKEIRELIAGGEYDQHRLFDLLYRKHNVHYARLREMIAEVKNG